MMTAADYVSQVVAPTLEEFRQHRTDLRRGMLASMAVLHVVDFVMQNRVATREAGDDAVRLFKRRLEGSHAGFYTVNKFALASKHGALVRHPGFDTDQHQIRQNAALFVMGFPVILPELVVLDGGTQVDLLQAIDETMALYRNEFPEAFAAQPARNSGNVRNPRNLGNPALTLGCEPAPGSSHDITPEEATVGIFDSLLGLGASAATQKAAGQANANAYQTGGPTDRLLTDSAANARTT